ncbi:hypothetical protein [Bosea sp. 117]|uniref:hypothetical protein n=1 Tax=Bosea sp. 117 TaxID=1125973 RepID=UPI000493ECEF|nr:hypothetical protein [Bosea sp. 117]
MLHPATAFVVLAVPAAFVFAGEARAERLPRPSVDYALSGRTAAGAVELVYGGGRMRLDVALPGAPGVFTGYIDDQQGRVTVLLDIPGMRNRAVEVDLPDDYVFVNLPAEGARIGRDTVAGEACDIWRAGSGGRTIDACITADGIVLRAQASAGTAPQLVFEAKSVRRGPQDPANLALPEGVKVRAMPPGVQNILPGLGR